VGVVRVPESALPEELRGLSVVPVTSAIHRECGLVCSASGKASDVTQALLKGARKEQGQ